MNTEVHCCPLCSQEAVLIGKKSGRLDSREYTCFHCNACHFSFIGNPRTDYAAIYSEDYYKGLGADPLVDYLYELDRPELTIRNYEWQGVCAIFNDLSPNGGRWLDFGCGVGGLVAFAKQQGLDVVGFEEGWGAQAARLKGISILSADELKAEEGRFDFVTAIEVMEHTVDPLATLRVIRSLLKPGGIFFFTTGNAKPWRGRLLEWSYTACPEVHISFFEPETLIFALQKTGFEARQGISLNGFVGIIKYKVLKTLGLKKKNWIINMLPWRLLSSIVDSQYQVARLPVGIAINNG